MLARGVSEAGLPARQARVPGLRVEITFGTVMNFKELLEQLQDRIGYHQIPINPAATGTRDLFESCPVHHELIKDLLQAIYKANACRKLTDEVRRYETFSALEPIRLQVLRSGKADVDQVELIEELCGAIDLAFVESEPQRNSRSNSRDQRSAEVISLERFRYRRFQRRA